VIKLQTVTQFRSTQSRGAGISRHKRKVGLHTCYPPGDTCDHTVASAPMSSRRRYR